MAYAAFTWDTASGRRKTAPIIVDGSRTANGTGRQRTARQPGKKFRYFNIDAVCRFAVSHVNAALVSNDDNNYSSSIIIHPRAAYRGAILENIKTCHRAKLITSPDITSDYSRVTYTCIAFKLFYLTLIINI